MAKVLRQKELFNRSDDVFKLEGLAYGFKVGFGSRIDAAGHKFVFCVIPHDL